jgi:hypothetical protein
MYMAIFVFVIDDNFDCPIAVTRTLKIFETCIYMYEFFIHSYKFVHTYTYACKYTYLIA